MSTDHDLLIEIHADLKNFMKKFEEHEEENKETFKEIENRVVYLEKRYWIAVGLVAAIEVVAKFL